MATKKWKRLKSLWIFVSEELSKVVKQKMGLLDLIDEVWQLKAVIKEKYKKIEELERKVEDLEQYTRRDDFVISSLSQPNYARITAANREGESKCHNSICE